MRGAKDGNGAEEQDRENESECGHGSPSFAGGVEA
jgi:hypothetical protein